MYVDIVVSVGSALLVEEAEDVEEFVENRPQLEALPPQQDLLPPPALPHQRRALIVSLHVGDRSGPFYLISLQFYVLYALLAT